MMEHNGIVNVTLSYDDELERLITSSSNALSQYVIFRSGFGEFYAINVLKVEELLVYKELDISTNVVDSYNLGVCKVRDDMVDVVHFDRWLGKGEVSREEYELVMLCACGGEKIGILIKDVVAIMDIDKNSMYPKHDESKKFSFITEIDYKNSKALCLLIDTDRLLLDTKPELSQTFNESLEADQTAVESKKTVVVAEDSKLMQTSIAKMLEKLSLDTKIFNNGKETMDYLKDDATDADSIGLIITDIEMPVADGFYVLEECKNSEKLENIPIVVNSNLSNSLLADRAVALGSKKIIEKPNFETLSQIVSEIMG